MPTEFDPAAALIAADVPVGLTTAELMMTPVEGAKVNIAPVKFAPMAMNVAEPPGSAYFGVMLMIDGGR